jgi:hypothetical protein
MFAINKLEDYLQTRASPAAARELKRLVEALRQEAEYPLARLYEIDFEAFELALELLHDWRIDRYYADRVPALARMTSDGGEGVPA